MHVAIMLEGQDGLNWARWKRLAQAAEDLGFYALNRSDHFSNASGEYKDALEIWTSFSYLATATKRIRFGALVSPVSFRNPVIAAWTATAINDLSGGRFHLGLGAGWQDREHTNFDFPLLETVPERMQRLEEALQVVNLLIQSDEPFDFSGTYYNLHDAVMHPRPEVKGGPTIVVGGNGPKRTIPMAVKHANEWNAVYLDPEGFKGRVELIEELLAQEGRDSSTFGRSLMTRVVIGETEVEAIAKLNGADVEALRARGVVIGDPDQVAAGLNAYKEAGVQRLDAQWLDMDDIAGLELIAAKVFPQIS
ncbi:LLM class F420-dependent oxidoreductase [soil metagenome]